MSQRELSLLSGVPERAIKAYDQEEVELSRASGETLYALSRILSLPIEDLLK